MSIVNVNLRPCDTPHLCAANGGEHVSVCAARPVLIPCPIPRSVAFTVVLGECDCRWWAPDPKNHVHHSRCPARPIRVTCSISGSTWEESEVNRIVVGVEAHRDGGAALAACRDRWALVKALVLGYTAWDYTMSSAKAVPLATITAMLAQRDAVFAALAKARSAEDALIEALGDYEESVMGEPVGIYGLKRETDGALDRYVKRLVEQVGNLT